MSLASLEPAFLLLPEKGDREFLITVRKVRLLALRRLLVASSAESGPGSHSLGRVQQLLVDVAREQKTNLLDALGEVDVLAPLLCLSSGQGDPARCLGDAVPALLCALAEREALPSGVIWEAPVHRVRLARTGRVWNLERPARALYADRGVVELQLSDGSRREVTSLDPDSMLFPIRPGLELSLHDTNPLVPVDLCLDPGGNVVGLGPQSAEDWCTGLDASLELVNQVLPGWASELSHALRRVVPVSGEASMDLSASSRVAPGLCYLSHHSSPLTRAEALIHETQHGKLHVLSYLDPVLHNSSTEWSTSRIRSDLRSLWGLLLAVHAFVPVSVMHARMAEGDHPLCLESGFANRRAEVLKGNLHAMRILEAKGSPSAVGDRLLRDLRRVLNVLRTAHSDPLPESEVLPSG